MWEAAAVSAWLDPVLAEGAAGTVHSVFAHAANLLLGGHREGSEGLQPPGSPAAPPPGCQGAPSPGGRGAHLVGLQDPRRGHAPFAISLAPPPAGYAAAGWHPGAPAAVRGGFLWVGAQAISLRAPRWDPLAPCPPMAPPRERAAANAAQLACLLAASGRREGLLPQVLAPAGPVAALLAGNPAAAPGLVGLGAGLTPAGDDLLAGLLATLVLGQADHLARPLADAVLAHAHRTTAVAAALLAAAARGGLPERVGDLLSDLFRRDGPAALARAGAALALGHSSGTDLCCGLLAGLRWLAHRPADRQG